MISFVPHKIYHLTTYCNVTIYTIDMFSDLFPRSQWLVKLPKNTMPANSEVISLNWKTNSL